jgi:transmembrane protein EpsG
MSDFTSLVFYLSVFILSAVLFTYGFKRKSKVIIALSTFIPVLVGGLRKDVGTDYGTYLAIFNSIKDQSFNDYLTSGPTEVGYFVIAKLAYLIGGGDVLFFTIFSAITIFFFCLGLRRLKVNHKPLVYFLFLMTIFPGSFNIVRQSAAVSVLFYAYSMLLDGKKKQFLFWGIVASFIHLSALIAIPILILTYVNSQKAKIENTIKFNSLIRSVAPALVVLIMLPFGFYILDSIQIFEKYALYQNLDLEGANYTFILKLVTIIVFYMLAYKLIKTRNELTFLSLSGVEVALTLLGFIAGPIKRIGMYFSPFTLLILPRFIDIFSDKFGKHIASTTIILFAFIFFILSYYVLGQADIIPFKSVIGSVI